MVYDAWKLSIPANRILSANPLLSIMEPLARKITEFPHIIRLLYFRYCHPLLLLFPPPPHCLLEMDQWIACRVYVHCVSFTYKRVLYTWRWERYCLCKINRTQVTCLFEGKKKHLPFAMCLNFANVSTLNNHVTEIYFILSSF